MSNVVTLARRAPVSTAADLLRQLGEGLREDLRGYAQLRDLLERQFQAALRHEASRMSELSAQILTQVAELDTRRGRRAEVLVALLGRRETRPSLRELLGRMPAGSAEPLAAMWRELEAALSGCKALNLRNCQLITEQQALMQQLLGREEHFYAER